MSDTCGNCSANVDCKCVERYIAEQLENLPGRRERFAVAFAARLISPDLLRAYYEPGQSQLMANTLNGVPQLARQLADALIAELDR